MTSSVLDRVSKAKRSRPVVAVVGTCDTKLGPLVFVKRVISASNGCGALLIDIGSSDPSETSNIDISRHEVLEFAEGSQDTSSRAAASQTMTTGLTRLLSLLHKRDIVTGAFAAGGSGNTSVCAQSFREAFPVGFSKLIVSTMASGDVGHYVGETDITMMYSVVDIAGMNSILEVILGNAARAIAGMSSSTTIPTSLAQSRPAVAVTMFGVTTTCVQYVTEKLETLGYEVVVFHATGAGGLAMERLIAEGRFVGVLDLTTTELADELVGGVLTAGPHRLEAAAKARIPQVVSTGALDMVNFHQMDTVPKQFLERLLYKHNSSITLMRTSRDECEKLGEVLASKLNAQSVDLTTLVLPLRGCSLLSVRGSPFYDPGADDVLFGVLRNRARCSVVEVDADINDKKFADTVVDNLLNLLSKKQQ